MRRRIEDALFQVVGSRGITSSTDLDGETAGDEERRSPEKGPKGLGRTLREDDGGGAAFGLGLLASLPLDGCSGGRRRPFGGDGDGVKRDGLDLVMGGSAGGNWCCFCDAGAGAGADAAAAPVGALDGDGGGGERATTRS